MKLQKRSLILNPFLRANKFAFSMIGPSATGSEKGTPNSKISTPLSFKLYAKSTVKLLLGKDVVIYPTNFFQLFS